MAATWHTCIVWEAGPQPDSGTVAINLEEIGGAWKGWRVPVAMPKEVLTAALVAMSIHSQVGVMIDDTSSHILRFNVRAPGS